MNKIYKAIFIAIICAQSFRAQDPKHYQLKIYSFETNDQMVDTDNYLKNSLIPLLKKSGIKSVGVFKPRKNVDSKPNSTYVLIPFNSLKEFALLNNTYVEESRNIHKHISYSNTSISYSNTSNTITPFDKIESVLIKANLQLPIIKNQKDNFKKENRVYELITYKATEQDVLEKDKNGIVANYISKLKDNQSLNEIFYGEVLSDQATENLMYMTSYTYNEIIEPVAIEKERISQKTWKKKRREQKKNLKQKTRQPINDIKKPKKEKRLRSVINKPATGITNLLFATEYSDF